ncbi:alpha/beta hydrolase [Patescibacteria group bacterium AH-259-L05]|nr:alpha/beta hydrolase [Patescibacteria group bacterium AH-259-L05]
MFFSFIPHFVILDATLCGKTEMEVYMKDPEVITQGIGYNHEVAIYYPPELSSDTFPIFMLHGNWATRGRNTNYAHYFSQKGFLVITPTYRYHHKDNHKGVIGAKLGKTSILDYVNDIEFLIEQLYKGDLIKHKDFVPQNQPIVMGHSMGGLVAQRLAVQRPKDKQLSALILLCSGPPAGISLHADKDYKKRIARFAGRVLLGKPYIPDLESMSKYIYNGMPKESHANLYAGAVYDSGTASREIIAGSGTGLVKFLAKLLSNPIEVNAHDIKCPILIVGCENDKVIAPAIANDLYEKYQKRSAPTTLKIFKGFSHWTQYESGWETSADFIYSWIRKNVHT